MVMPRTIGTCLIISCYSFSREYQLMIDQYNLKQELEQSINDFFTCIFFFFFVINSRSLNHLGSVPVMPKIMLHVEISLSVLFWMVFCDDFEPVWGQHHHCSQGVPKACISWSPREHLHKVTFFETFSRYCIQTQIKLLQSILSLRGL